MKHQIDFRILAVAPSTRGLGYAVLEGTDMLVDWGIKTVKTKDKNKQSLSKVAELIARYQPGVLVLEDASAKGSRRSPRIKALCRHIITLAKDRKVNLQLFSREQVMKTLIPEGERTKYAVAEIVANRFTEQLGSKLPPKRKPWMNESYQMATFEAVALALVFRMNRKRQATKYRY